MNINFSNSNAPQVDQIILDGVRKSSTNNQGLQSADLAHLDHPEGWHAENFNIPVIDLQNPQHLKAKVFLGEDIVSQQDQLEKAQRQGLTSLKKAQTAHIASDVEKAKQHAFFSVNSEVSLVNSDQEASSEVIEEEENFDDVEIGTEEDRRASLVDKAQESNSNLEIMEEESFDDVEFGTEDDQKVSLAAITQESNVEIIEEEENFDDVEIGTEDDQQLSLVDKNGESSSSVVVKMERNSETARSEQVSISGAKAAGDSNNVINNTPKVKILEQGLDSNNQTVKQHFFYIISKESRDKVKAGQSSSLHLTPAGLDVLDNAEKIDQLVKDKLLVFGKMGPDGKFELRQVVNPDDDSNHEDDLEHYIHRITSLSVDLPTGGHRIIDIKDVKLGKMTIAEAFVCINQAKQALNAEKDKRAPDREGVPEFFRMDYANRTRSQQVQEAASNLANDEQQLNGIQNYKKQQVRNADQTFTEHIVKERELHEAQRERRAQKREEEFEKSEEDHMQFTQRQETIKSQKDKGEVRSQEVHAEQVAKKNTKKIQRPDVFNPERREEITGVVDNTDPLTVKENRTV